MMKIGLVFGLLGLATGSSNVFQTLDSESTSDWIESTNSRYAGQKWSYDDTGMTASKPHKHYGISRVLDVPIEVNHKDGFVFQYEVKYGGGATCSGSYVKLLIADESFKAEELEESSGYSIMFGPDVCGTSTNKVHFIVRQENPVTKKFEEKHFTSPATPPSDKVVHLYTLQIRPDNTFSILVDGKESASGSLTKDDDFTPPFAQPEQIDDPDDKKPADWVDNAKMPDPSASKPDDWDEDAPKKIPDPAQLDPPSGWLVDEPKEVADPAATEPEDWDEEDDGEWEAPLVPNPKCSVGCGEWKPPLIDNPDYKGKWSAPMIDNPDYVGEWAPQKIDNPAYFKEDNPVSTIKPIGAVAIEILVNDAGLNFQSVMIGNSLKEAEEYVQSIFLPKQADQKAEEKAAAKEVSKEERLKALEEGGIGGMIQFYTGELQDALTDMWEENPALLGGAGLGLLIVPFLLFRGSGGSEDDDEALHKKDDDAAAEEDDEVEEDDNEDEDDDEDGEDDEGDKGGLRRIPKAN